MVNTLVYPVLSALFLLIQVSNGIAFQNEDVDRDRELVEASGEIVSLGKYGICKLDLGTVESGKKLLVSATLKNHSTHSLVFKSVSTSSSYVSVFPESGRIGVLGELNFQIKIDVPKSNASSRFPATFYLVGDDKSEIGVNCFLNISSNLYIAPNYQFAVGKKFEKFIPLEISDPIKFRKLEFDASEKFSGIVKFSLAEKDGQPGGRLRTTGKGLTANYFEGQIKIRDSVSGKAVDSSLLFRSSQPVTITPAALQFYEDSSGEADTDDVYRARALLRIDSETLNTIGSPKAECFIDDHLLPDLKIRRLTKNLYRIELSVLRSFEYSDHSNVIWKIKGIGEVQKGTAVFP